MVSSICRLRFTICYLISWAAAIPHLSLSSREDKFVFGTIGDSWASGVQWDEKTAYDGNKNGCMRYKYAWSTVVNQQSDIWTPKENQATQFEFVACSGAHLDNLPDQMDKMTRPKLVLMEAGGNNADFYPMADACLFHANLTRREGYGKRYEDDDPQNPQGECRKEMNLVRGRLQGDNMKNQVIQAIHKWRGHKSVSNNDATLALLGYPRFFALDARCNEQDFTIHFAAGVQKLVLEMRKDFNDLVDDMNKAIREAVESFSEKQIRYIDINPAFEGHRFCEANFGHYDDINWTTNVWIWNSPGKYMIKITTNGRKEDFVNTSAPKEIVDKLTPFPVGRWDEDDRHIIRFKNPEEPSLMMEYIYRKEDPHIDNGGKIARTLHPTEEGHASMGHVIAKHLREYYGRVEP